MGALHAACLKSAADGPRAGRHTDFSGARRRLQKSQTSSHTDSRQLAARRACLCGLCGLSAGCTHCASGLSGQMRPFRRVYSWCQCSSRLSQKKKFPPMRPKILCTKKYFLKGNGLKKYAKIPKKSLTFFVIYF